MTKQTTPFKEWAMCYYRHRKLDKFAKDFFVDMIHDDGFPQISCDKNYLIRYLHKMGACDAALEGFNEIWACYERVFA